MNKTDSDYFQDCLSNVINIGYTGESNVIFRIVKIVNSLDILQKQVLNPRTIKIKRADQGPILKKQNSIFLGKNLNFEENTVVFKSVLPKTSSKTVQCYHTLTLYLSI